MLSLQTTLYSIQSLLYVVKVWSRTHYGCVRGENDLCSNMPGHRKRLQQACMETAIK